MGRRGRRAALVGLALIVLIAVGYMLLPGQAAQSVVYAYPVNARQLIAAGLAATPLPSSPSEPVAVDRVFADGIRAVVIFHVVRPVRMAAGRGWQSPTISLLDERGQPFALRSAGYSFNVTPPPPTDLRSLVGWAFDNVIAFARRGVPPLSYATFDAVGSAAHAVIVRIGYQGATELVRVPLHLAAMHRTFAAVPRPRIAVTWRGAMVRVTRMVRGVGSARIDYAVDIPAGAATVSMVRDQLRDAQGRVHVPQDGWFNCDARGMRAMDRHCDGTTVFTPLARGARLTLIINLIGNNGQNLRGRALHVHLREP